MLNLLKYSSLLVMLIYCASPVDSCAPYFSSQVWKQLENSYKNMSNVNQDCKADFVDIASQTVITGQKFCTDIFATKLFVAKNCEGDCKKPPGSVLSGINCNNYRVTGDGNTPENIIFQFNCIYSVDNVPGLPCLSREYSFQDVQQYFAENCISTSSSSASSASGASSASSASGASSASSASGASSASSGSTTSTASTTPSSGHT